jgi:hypothetical protein
MGSDGASHAQQLRELAIDKAEQTAKLSIKEARFPSITSSQITTQAVHIKREEPTQADIKKEQATTDCPATIPHGLGTTLLSRAR